MQTPGLPDRYYVHRDFVGWVEWKKDEGKLRQNQVHMMRELLRRNTPAFVARYLSNTEMIVLENVLLPFVRVVSLTNLTGIKFIFELASYWREIKSLMDQGCGVENPQE